MKNVYSYPLSQRVEQLDPIPMPQFLLDAQERSQSKPVTTLEETKRLRELCLKGWGNSQDSTTKTLSCVSDLLKF